MSTHWLSVWPVSNFTRGVTLQGAKRHVPKKTTRPHKQLSLMAFMASLVHVLCALCFAKVLAGKGYDTKVDSQADYQKRDVSKYKGVSIDVLNAAITVTLHKTYLFNSICDMHALLSRLYLVPLSWILLLGFTRDCIPNQMGPKRDIRIYASKPKQVAVDADLVAAGDLHVQGKFTINGKDLMDILKELQDKIGSGGGGGGGSGPKDRMSHA